MLSFFGLMVWLNGLHVGSYDICISQEVLFSVSFDLQPFPQVGSICGYYASYLLTVLKKFKIPKVFERNLKIIFKI